MNLLEPTEIALLAPQVAESPLLATEQAKIGYISQATAMAEAACGRGKYGLELRDLYNIDVRLDQNLTGVLPSDPWWEWLSVTAELFSFGDVTPSEVAMADFSVDSRSGVIRNLTSRPGSYYDGGFGGGRGDARSPYGQAVSQYHAGSYGQVENNSRPFVLKVSFRAGHFVERFIETSGAAGAGEVVVVGNARGFRPGDEVYFSTDPAQQTSASAPDRRFVTEVDYLSRVVKFEPAVSYALPASARLKRVDRAVRSAVADIVADLVTYPPNTRVFRKNLGKSDLDKAWTRMNDVDIPPSAMRKLADYVRV